VAATGVMDAFTLPAHLEAAEPPEARGLPRDGVRLLISLADTDSVHHAHFSDLPRWLSPGDLLVVNTSATLNAALEVTTRSGDAFELHLSTRVPGNFWVVEVRCPGPVASLPYRHAQAGTVFDLEGGGQITLLAPYPLAGRLDEARALLGRDYRISGRVIEGEQLGRRLGFRTANLRLQRRVSPVAGIFAVRVSGPGLDRQAGIASVGTRPTVGGSGWLLEVHLFDFDGDLYGARLDVDFIARLRDEVRFDSVEAMTAQMHDDARLARQLLAH